MGPLLRHVIVKLWNDTVRVCRNWEMVWNRKHTEHLNSSALSQTVLEGGFQVPELPALRVLREQDFTPGVFYTQSLIHPPGPQLDEVCIP